MEKIAVCHLKGRVAPRYDLTQEFFIVTINKRKEIVERMVVGITEVEPLELAGEIQRLKVSALICGGVREDWRRTLKKNGILLIDNVIGKVEDVLNLYLKGELRRGDVVS